MTTIDLHQHLWPPGFVELLRARSVAPRLDGTSLLLPEGAFTVGPADHDIALRLDRLDADEIDLAVVSLQTTLGLEALPEAERATLEQAWIDGARELVAASQGRLQALGPGRLVDGFAGVSVAAGALGDLEATAPLLDAAERSGAFVFVHPGPVERRSDMPPWWSGIVAYTSQMQAAWFAWLESGRERWPGLRVVFAILAGGAPFHLERLALRGVDVRSTLDANVFLDVATYGRRAIELCVGDVRGRAARLRLRHARRRLGADLERRPGIRRCCRPTHRDGQPWKSAPMSKLARWIADRVPPDSELDARGCDEVARAIVTEESLWREHVQHDEESRFFRQLYRDPALDVWLICWTDRQDTGYHDHDRSSGAVCVADGVLLEDYFQRDNDGWIREKTNRHELGGSFHFESSYIHGVRHVGVGATSIHVYSPALWRMGHYEHDERGVMRRVSMTYADELLGAL